MSKEKLIEEFRYDYYRTGKLTYTETDGTTRADVKNIIDWWLSKFDSHTEELKKKIEGIETTYGISQSSSYEIGKNHGRQEFKRKVLSELNHQ